MIQTKIDPIIIKNIKIVQDYLQLLAHLKSVPTESSSNNNN